MRCGRLSGKEEGKSVDSGWMSEGSRERVSIEHRIERAVFETDRQLVVGDVTLPPEGYQSRFSDVLNRRDFDFLSLTNVEITSLVDGKVSERPFVVLSKNQVRIAFPYNL
jgi:hypothetical protein